MKGEGRRGTTGAYMRSNLRSSIASLCEISSRNETICVARLSCKLTIVAPRTQLGGKYQSGKRKQPDFAAAG